MILNNNNNNNQGVFLKQLVAAKNILNEAMTMNVAKLFVYFTLNDISGVTLVFFKSWFVLV